MSEARLSALETKMAAMEARLASLESGATAAASLPEVDIDGQYGDPLVRKDPPKWKGQSYRGQPMSLCPPDYLRALAGFKQWCAAKERKEGKDKYAGYSLMDASRALAWAKRKETTKAAASSPGVDQFDDGEADAFHSQFDDGAPF